MTRSPPSCATTPTWPRPIEKSATWRSRPARGARLPTPATGQSERGFRPGVGGHVPPGQGDRQGRAGADECRGAHYKPEFAMPASTVRPPSPDAAARRQWCDRFEENNRKWLKTPSPLVPDGEPHFSYEDSTLADPAAAAALRPAGDEAGRQVWRERQEKPGTRGSGDGGERGERRRRVDPGGRMAAQIAPHPTLSRRKNTEDMKPFSPSSSRRRRPQDVRRSASCGRTRPGAGPYWQQSEVEWEPYMNCISVLERSPRRP